MPPRAMEPAPWSSLATNLGRTGTIVIRRRYGLTMTLSCRPPMARFPAAPFPDVGMSNPDPVVPRPRA